MNPSDYITVSTTDDWDIGETITFNNFEPNINYDLHWSDIIEKHVPVDKIKILEKIKNEMPQIYNDEIPF